MHHTIYSFKLTAGQHRPSLQRTRTRVTCTLTNAHNAPLYAGDLIGPFVRIQQDSTLLYFRTDRVYRLKTATIALPSYLTQWKQRLAATPEILGLGRQTARETYLSTGSLLSAVREQEMYSPAFDSYAPLSIPSSIPSRVNPSPTVLSFPTDHTASRLEPLRSYLTITEVR